MVGLRRGGLLETVLDGETGELVDGADPGAYAAAVDRVGALDPDHIRRHAQQFSAEEFARRMARWVEHAAT